MRWLRDLAVEGKRVLVRVDYNVPLSDEGLIENDARLRHSLETLEYLLQHDAKIILLTHIGRPEGKPDSALSTEVLLGPLMAMLKTQVVFVDDIVGEEAQRQASELTASAEGTPRVLLLQNLRFDPREEANDPVFAKALASLGDVYVDDAFAVSHRKHASLVGVPHYLPSALGAGFEREYHMLSSIESSPEKPFHVVLGGVKIETRLPMMEHLLTEVGVEKMLLGGALTNAFFVAQGHSIGASPYEDSYVQVAKDLLERFSDQLVLPTDVVVATDRSDLATFQTVSVDAIPEGMLILDIGPESIRRFSEVLTPAKTIFWNGPMGAFEYKPFVQATRDLAEFLVRQTKEQDVLTVVGGGDTVSVLEQLGFAGGMSFVSTGGGAALTMFAGKLLPAVEAISESPLD